MANVLEVLSPENCTFAKLCEHLGGIPAERIRFVPAPGHARDSDVADAKDRYGAICELIDGVLVAKTMDSYRSVLEAEVVFRLGNFVAKRDLGILLGPAGVLRLVGQIRAPDVSFIAWERFPGRKLPAEAIYSVAPDLAIEVLSPSNTEREMSRKLDEYFAAGARLVWYIDPERQAAQAFTGVNQATDVGPGGVLSGADVLPGFELSLAALFARVGPKQSS